MSLFFGSDSVSAVAKFHLYQTSLTFRILLPIHQLALPPGDLDSGCHHSYGLEDLLMLISALPAAACATTDVPVSCLSSSISSDILRTSLAKACICCYALEHANAWQAQHVVSMRVSSSQRSGEESSLVCIGETITHLGEPIEDTKAAWKAAEEMLGSQIEEEQGYDQLRMSCEDDPPSGEACPLDPSRWESSCEQLARGGETA